MIFEDCCCMIDKAAAFYDYHRVEGWFYCPDDTLASVAVSGVAAKGVSFTRKLPYPGVEHAYGPDRGFVLQALLLPGADVEAMNLVFRTSKGRLITANVQAMARERDDMLKGMALFHHFLDLVAQQPGMKLLDIGGRDRSGHDRSQLFESADCTVLDILPGDNVDVVGDAHAMSKLLPAHYFDAVFSQSTFEHLLMPWVVAGEMSQVMKPGAIAFIHTHQTIGMHDQPWDFWRFSDTAWDGIFNKVTGFEILDRAMESPQFIIPHFYSAHRNNNIEGPVGFLGSCVLVRKTGAPSFAWHDLDAAAVVATAYPNTEAYPDTVGQKQAG
jgi:hypothetical protein